MNTAERASGERSQDGSSAAAHMRPRLTRQAVKTLDAVLALEPWPSRAVLDEICLVHKVPRQEVLKYVKLQRT